MKRIDLFTMARILSFITGKHSTRKGVVAEALVLDPEVALKGLQALERRGFIYLNDRFNDDASASGNKQRRKDGKYGEGLFVCNYEPVPVNDLEALEMIQGAKKSGQKGFDYAMSVGKGC